MQRSRKLRSLFSLVFFAFLFSSVQGYETFYMLEVCQNKSSNVINMHSLQSNSSGMLKVSTHGKFVPDIDCEIQLTPPLSYGVAASIRLLNIPPQRSDYKECINYVEIHKNEKRSEKLCGYSYDVLEFQSYESYGPMRITLHTGNRTNISASTTSLQFHIIFTAFRSNYKVNPWCPEDEFLCDNKKCIWKGLKCDGHNNCGDFSDESKSAKCDRSLSTGECIGVIAGTVVVCGAIILLAVCARRYAMKQTFQSIPGHCYPENISSVSCRNPQINSADSASTTRTVDLEDPPPKYEDILHSTRTPRSDSV